MAKSVYVPKSLGRAGAKLYRDIAAKWELRPDEQRVLLDACSEADLVDDLAAASADFARFWKQHDVLERQGGQRDFRHPQRGLVSYQQITLHPVEQEQLKLVMLKPCKT